MIRKILSSLLSLGLLFVPAAVSTAKSSSDLTPAALAAFSDVGRCLISDKNPKLSVFYLIDNSGSLTWTDPENERKEILEGSIRELGSFVDRGVEVRIAAHLFSTSTVEALPWTSLSTANDATKISAEVGKFIDNDIASGSTDWEEGLSKAYDELNSVSSGCKMLIWFTDGGINPDNTDAGRDASLAALCRPNIGIGSVGSGSDFGLMSDFRKAQIPVFGVLYSNLDLANEYFQTEDASTAPDRLAYEKWLMSFMRPLVEGRGEVESQEFFGETAAGGQLECANVQGDGTALPEQSNGAFLNAEDPVALAYEFMKLGTKISGGLGSPIENGTFVIPPGTAKFVVLVGGSNWELAGPEGSEIQAKSGGPSGAVAVRESAGARSLEVVTISSPELLGEWTLNSFDSNAELFLFSGLTFRLDRDRSSKILSDYPNTITGRIVRTAEFEEFAINLEDFPRSDLSMYYSSGGKWVPAEDVVIETSPTGEFSIANFSPPAQLENLGVRLSLNIGDSFSPVESDFELTVQDKTAFARPSADTFVLSNLVGPSGSAEGLVVLEGPNTSPSSEFCFAVQTRIDDTQSGIEKLERTDQFVFTFTDTTSGASGNCFTLLAGQEIPILVAVTNPTQADAEVVSVWNITSGAEGVDTQFEAPMRFTFKSETVTNSAVVWTVLLVLMILGLLLPLLAMYFLNFFTTRFLDLENTVRAVIPVRINASGPEILSDGRVGLSRPWEIGTRDFLNVMDQKAPRVVETGFGTASSRIPIFPLAATWYEWQSPEASRVLTHNLSSSKSTKEIKRARASEISPNMSENWALVVPDAELLKSSAGAQIGNLIVYSKAGTIPTYEARIRKILNSPALRDSIRSASEAAKSAATNSTEKVRKSKTSETPLEMNLLTPTSSGPDIPGFDAAKTGRVGSKPTSGVPGFEAGPITPEKSNGSMPPNIPGFGNDFKP